MILIVALAIGLGLWYLLDRRDPFTYLPGSFAAYVQLPSLRSAYEDWIGQESVERAIAAAGLGQVRKGIIDLRGMEASKSALRRSLVDVRADLMVLQGGAMLGTLSLGPRSLLTRIAPAFGPLVSLKGLSFIKESGFSYFEYGAGSMTFYAAPAGDLLVISTDRKTLQAAFASRGAEDRLSARNDVRTLSALAGATRGMRFLVDSGSILSTGLSQAPAGKRLLESMEFASESVADLQAGDEGIRLDLEIPVSSKLSEIDDIIASSGGRSKLLPLLPPSTSFCAGLNVRELVLLFKALGAVEPKIAESLEKADGAAKAVLGYGFDEFLFSWAGGEAAVVQAKGSASPILCLAVKDEAARKDRLGKALALPIFAPREQDFGGARMTRVSFPWWVKAILQAAKVEIEDPYIAEESGFFFASQDPDALASILNGIRSGERLREQDSWKPAFADAAGSPLAYCFYDAGTRPFFLGSGAAAASILDEFGRGLLEVSPSREGLFASLRAIPAPEGEGGSRYAVGFPVKLGDRIESLALLRIGGSSIRIAAFGRDVLTIVDPAFPAQPVSAEAPKGSVAVPGDARLLWSVAEDGIVGLWNAKAEAEPTFPRPGESSKMPPLAIQSGLVSYSTVRKGLVLTGVLGEASDFGPALAAPVLSRPAASGDLVAFVTKGFDSLVYLVDSSGKVLPGWPVEGGGLSYGSPALSSGEEGGMIAFLSQGGKLSLWTQDGAPRDEFPIDLEGVFYATPAVCVNGHQRLVVCANQDGAIYVVSEYGSILSTSVVPDAAGKRARLTAFDADRNGTDELYVSGESNMTLGFSLPDLSPLPGFPLPGGLGPLFADIDADGDAEIVTASADGAIYAR